MAPARAADPHPPRRTDPWNPSDLTGSRGQLRVRPFERGDAGDLLALWLDPEVARWTGVPDRPTEALALAWIETRGRRERAGRGIDRAVTVGGAFAGAVSLDADADGDGWSVAWSVAAAYRGRGVATAATKLLLAEAPPGPLMAEVDPANLASVRVAEKLGRLSSRTASPGR